MAGACAALMNAEQQRVAVTVESDVHNILSVPGGLTFSPEGLP